MLALIQTHPRVGYDILKEIEFPWPIAQMVYQHHERMQGTGYPQGLKGNEILLDARILSVADVKALNTVGKEFTRQGFMHKRLTPEFRTVAEEFTCKGFMHERLTPERLSNQ